jgi:signal transduction histidine kinase
VAGLVLILFFVDQIRYLNQVIVAGTQDVLDFSMHIMAETLVFALATYFIVQLVSTLLDERQMRQQLAEAHAQLQHYAQRIEDLAAVQERNRIARDIHDSLGHALTTLNVQLQTAVKLWQKDPGKAKPFLVQAQHLGATAMKEVRQSVGTLRADVEDRRSLNEKIYTLVADFRKGTDLTVYIDLDDCRLLPNSISKTLFRVVQESLTNISKHAQATTVTLEIDVMHDIVHLTVADNGQGFSLSQVKQGFGLQSMKERVAVLHGCMFFETNPGEGCSIYASIPLKSRSHPNFRVPQSAKLSPIGILDRNS